MAIKIVIEDDQHLNYEDSIFLTGFHGIGWTGYIAIRHIIKTTGSKRIGYIIGDNLPDIVSIEEDHLVLPFEFYSYKNFIIFQPSFQPLLDRDQKLIKELAHWITKSKFKQALLLGGLDIRFQEEAHMAPMPSQELRLAPTQANFLEAKKYNLPFLDSGLLIRGPLALLLAHLEILNFPALAILPYAQPDRPDPAAAAVSIEFLNTQFQLELSTSQLQTDAQRIEKEIQKILKQEQDRPEREPHDMYI